MHPSKALLQAIVDNPTGKRLFCGRDWLVSFAATVASGEDASWGPDPKPSNPKSENVGNDPAFRGILLDRPLFLVGELDWIVAA